MKGWYWIMARKKIDRYDAHRIPSIHVFSMSKNKIEQHGKFIVKLDGEWQFATSDIEEGFKPYISNPDKPDQNGINKKSKSSKSLILHKNSYEFDGILDYSLDLRHLIDYCEGNRSIKDYFKIIQGKKYCLAFVKVNFDKSTKEIREFFYRPDGFGITYDIDGEETLISYVRYKRTASGAREGSCLFIAEQLYEHMMSWSSAGIDQSKAKHIDSISWEAYVALTLSSIETTVILDPRQFLFIKDKETIIRHGKAFEITNSPNRDCLIPRHNIYSDADNDRTLTNKNKIWDGEGLIDDSIFAENETLKANYSDKCMLLLRGKLFKACMFRTHIQKWFKDNGISDETHKVTDLNGYTQAKTISDIKFIVPYSCLKFLKFKGDKSEETAIKNWITDIAGKRTVPLFGIIKSDKKSKLANGQKVFTTYQMLNTLGFDENTARTFLQPTIENMTKLSTPGEAGANYLKFYLDNFFFTPAPSYNDYGEESADISDTFKIFHYEEQTASTILKYDTDYYNTPHYRHIVESLLKHIKKQTSDVRVLIDGVYATLFCNGIELLKSVVDKNYEPDTNSKITITLNGSEQVLPLLKRTEIYTKRFSDNSKLLCARNPHITMGNYYLATNRKCMMNNKNKESVYDRYFVLSEEIVCVNAIDSDIMNTLNGCDFDSDTMLITNNTVMVDLLKQQLRRNEYSNKFRVPFNNVQSKTITPDDKTSEATFLSNVDDKLSNNLIGEIVNLSQRLNSLIWMLAPLKVQQGKYINWNKWTAEIGKNIYEKGCCTLAVLSNIEIDSAKRSYHCNSASELKKIRAILGKDYRKLKSYTSWLDNKMEINIPTINPDDKIMGIDILGLDPMGYIIQTITTAEQNTRKNISKPTVTDYEFISSLLNNLNITNTNSNCTDSFNSCLNALLSCYDYLDSQNVASKGNSYFKRSFVKDCMQITKCCNIINNILIKDTVSSDALLWQLINLLKDSSRLVKSSPDDAIYAIVDNKSDEYKFSSKEIRHDCPRALLWAALFVNNKSGNETYLSQHL